MSRDLPSMVEQWLGETDVGFLELTGPSISYRWVNRGGLVMTAPEGHAPQAGGQRRQVVAATVGVCLHRHPANDKPLVTGGQGVREGEIVGFLRIGSLLLPVSAPQKGVWVGWRVAHGEVVGYGTPLAHMDV